MLQRHRIWNNIIIFFFLLLPAGSYAGDIDMSILKYPENIYRFNDSYVRVKITNNGKAPVSDCYQSVSPDKGRCIALRWDFTNTPAVNLLASDFTYLLPHTDYLNPGEAMEKSIKITTALSPKENAVLNIYLIIRDGDEFLLKKYPLKVNIKKTLPDMQKKRVALRVLIYSYFAMVVFFSILIYRKMRRKAK